MKLSQWIRMHEAGSRNARVLQMILLGQLVLALAALGVDLAGVCGGCGAGDVVHAAIAGIGAAHYLVLLALQRAKMWTGVFCGVFAATGVHLSLGALMIARGSFCPICAAATLLALAGPAVLLSNHSGAVRWIPRATIPAFLLSGLLTWTIFSARDARAEALKAESRAAARQLLDQVKDAGGTSPRSTLELHVFESENCVYCREFRQVYAPRMAKDFPDVEIVYHDARGVPWVRRTPTIALGADLVFEGLPVDYQDLFRVVSHARASRLATKR